LSAIQKVEIVVPAIRRPKRESVALIISKLLYLGARTLIVFWFVATWFPELGLTYWSLVLPVWIASGIGTPISIKGRWIPAERLFRTGTGTEIGELAPKNRKKV